MGVWCIQELISTEWREVSNAVKGQQWSSHGRLLTFLALEKVTENRWQNP